MQSIPLINFCGSIRVVAVAVISVSFLLHCILFIEILFLVSYKLPWFFLNSCKIADIFLPALSCNCGKHNPPTVTEKIPNFNIHEIKTFI